MAKWLAACIFVALGSVQLASAGNIDSPDMISLSMNGCAQGSYCMADPGFAGSPATASANFALINQPYTFDLQTGNATSWVYNMNDNYYSAMFGYGGVFDMSGPNGLIFTGVVTSGTSESYDGQWQVQVDYSGQWSNGVYADGSADVQITEDGRDGTASLTIDQGTAPEPSTLALLGTAALGLIGCKRRLFL